MLATVNEHPARVRTLCIPADCSMRQAESRLLAATTSTRIADLARQQAFASRLVAAFEQGDMERVDSLVQPFLDATIATIPKSAESRTTRFYLEPFAASVTGSSRISDVLKQ